MWAEENDELQRKLNDLNDYKSSLKKELKQADSEKEEINQKVQALEQEVEASQRLTEEVESGAVELRKQIDTLKDQESDLKANFENTTR